MIYSVDSYRPDGHPAETAADRGPAYANGHFPRGPTGHPGARHNATLQHVISFYP